MFDLEIFINKKEKKESSPEWAAGKGKRNKCCGLFGFVFFTEDKRRYSAPILLNRFMPRLFS